MEVWTGERLDEMNATTQVLKNPSVTNEPPIICCGVVCCGTSRLAAVGAWDNIQRTPYAHNTLLDAVEEHLYLPQTIIVRGKSDALQSWNEQHAAVYAPRRMLITIPDDKQDLPGLLRERVPQGEFVAYVCDGHQCQPPITDAAAFEQLLQSP